MSMEAPHPLKIFELEGQSAEVKIVKENLAEVAKNLKSSGANYVCIVAVMGAYRTGKSFLLDLMIRYIKHKWMKDDAARRREQAQLLAKRAEATEDKPSIEKTKVQLDKVTRETANCLTPRKPIAGWKFSGDEPEKGPTPPLPRWMSQGEAEKISEGSKDNKFEGGFAWRPGKDRCTQGIWLWSHPYVFHQRDGRKVAVVLMDTQGAGDSTMAKAQSATIFGLTALLSSKLIYNIPNRVSEDELNYMDYLTTFTSTICADSPEKGSPFGHLQLLVRDWSNFEEGFSVAECQKQMETHRLDHMHPDNVPEDARAKIERLSTAFKAIGCTGLPHPGLKVTKPTYGGEINVINPDFWYLLDDFFETFFGNGFPQPSSPLGMDMTVNSFEQVVTHFAEAFQDSAEKMAVDYRQAFVKVQMIVSKEQLEGRFLDDLKKIAPISSVLDPVNLTKEVTDLVQQYVEEFREKLRPWKLHSDDEALAVNNFELAIAPRAEERLRQNTDLVEGATAKILASPVVGCGAYFLLVHTWVLAVVAAVGAYMHAKKFSTRNNTELYDVSVFQGILEDVKKFGDARHKDVQAMQVALSRFNSAQAMQGLQKAAHQAGMLATAAAAQAGVKANVPAAKKDD